MAKYRKTYLCVCEGQQEKMYLNHVARLIKVFPQKVVTFNSYIDSPKRLTKTYEDYDSAAIFDFDFNAVEFERNIRLCDKLNSKCKSTSRKKDRNIYHAYSNVNFDLWLLLHKEDYFHEVSRNDAYIDDVLRIYGLSSTDDIKNKANLAKILSQITLQDVKDAITRAERIKLHKIEGDGSKIGNSIIYSNPDFSIHEFLKIVLKESGDL